MVEGGGNKLVKTLSSFSYLKNMDRYLFVLFISLFLSLCLYLFILFPFSLLHTDFFLLFLRSTVPLLTCLSIIHSQTSSLTNVYISVCLIPVYFCALLASHSLTQSVSHGCNFYFTFWFLTKNSFARTF